MFYYDKNDPRVQFNDIREENCILCDGRVFTVSPDSLTDFRSLPYPDESFSLIVFDPPHLVDCGIHSWQGKKYGKLSKKMWKKDLRAGFEECWRCLKPCGTLIFKWSEIQIPLKEVMSCFSQQPVFGHTTTRNLKTHWMTFFKMEEHHD